ncbi:MAG: division/cell wall cluster transcriptional repressor MraZ [Alphaproteobacteria bacterium]|nr:division/cell wall cluster transcriptional repressor MraZ [Alphaproteobacteria bacterium]
MALFIGTHENKIDRKGRVSLPADYRAELPTEDDRAIFIFPSLYIPALEACDKAQLELHSQRINALDQFSQEEAYFSAQILAEARKISIDGDGRIVLPAEFMTRANIDGKALFVGGGPKFHIWQPGAYAEHREITQKALTGRTLPSLTGPTS